MKCVQSNLDRVLGIGTAFCLIVSTLLAAPRPSDPPLDDTAAFIHLAPAYQNVLACDSFAVNVLMTATNARVFDLRFVHVSADYELLSVTPGPHPNLHILPHDTTADTISVDGFFHPNFTGTTTIATLWLMKRTMVDDDTTEVGFIAGQGYSGTADLPEPIVFNGDTAIIDVEGTPPLAPTELIIIPYYTYAVSVDSVCLHWNPVYYDEDGDTLIAPEYDVVFEDVLNNSGVLVPIGMTTDTFYCDDYIVQDFFPYDSSIVNVGTYRIHTKRTNP